MILGYMIPTYDFHMIRGVKFKGGVSVLAACRSARNLGIPEHDSCAFNIK